MRIEPFMMFNYNGHVLIFSIIVMILISCNCQESSFILTNKSFSIVSSIIRHNGGPLISFWTENYSNSQLRAKIDLKLIKTQTNYLELFQEFYHDYRTNQSITFNVKTNECKNSTIRELYRSIFNSTSLLDYMNSISINKDNSNHVIGPSRLLFIIADRIDDLKLISNNGNNFTVRNIPAVEYQININGPYSSTVQVYYDKTNFDEKNLSNLMPLEIKLICPGQLVLTIEYFNYKLTHESSYQLNSFSINNAYALIESNEYMIDMFSFPISLNCSEFMMNNSNNDKEEQLTGQIDLFDNINLNNVKLSFTIETEHTFVDRASKYYIAYDSKLDMLRVDYIQQEEDRTHLKQHRSITSHILDFKINRRYVLVDKNNLIDTLDFEINNNNVNNNDPSIELDLTNKETHCSITYIEPPDITKEAIDIKLDLSKFLFGASKFVYMGLAQIRGLEVKVYEAYSKQMPQWIIPAIVFRDLNNNFNLRKGGSTMREDPADNLVVNYNIIIYVAHNDEQTHQSFKPILIELYNMKIDKTSLFRKSLIGKFYNFVWDINDAKTFEIYDSCISQDYNRRVKSNIIYKLNVLLEETWNDENDYLSETYNNNHNKLKIAKKRDELLVVALTNEIKLHRSSLYNFESKLLQYKRDDNNINAIECSLDFLEHPKEMFDIQFIGNAQINEKHLGDARVTFSRSLYECLWFIDSSDSNTLDNYETNQPSIYIFFYESYRNSFCFVVTDLIIEEQNDNRLKYKSDLITLNRHGPGELYKIEKYCDYSITVHDNNNFLFNKHIIDKTIILNEMNNEEGEEFLIEYKIKRFHIKPIYYDSRENNNKLPTIYSGFKYSTSIENEYCWLVEGENYHDEDDTETIEESFMSFDQCYAYCLSNLDCKSFSYCIKSINSACILSKFNIRTSLFENEMQLFKELSKKHRKKVPLKRIFNEQIEIISDARCEIHSKSYFNLFISSGFLKTTLKGHRVFPVLEEENCAQMCFERSLQSIQASIKINKEIELLLNDEINSSTDSSRIEKLHKEYQWIISKFCRNFLYIDESLLEDEKQKMAIKQKIVVTSFKNSTKQSHNGYCILEGDNNSIELDKELFNLNYYKFDFSSLYEKQFNIRLQQSPLDKDEYEAFMYINGKLNSIDSQDTHNTTTGINDSKVNQSFEFDDEFDNNKYDIIRKSIIEHKNFQQLHNNIGIENCAYLCFTKNTAIWPTCRSFDIVLKNDNNDDEQFGYSDCSINSLTFENAKQEDKQINSKKSLIVWHYEPKFSIIKWDKPINVQTEVHLLERSSDYYTSNIKRGIKRIQKTISKQIIYIIIPIALFSGFILSIIISRKLNYLLDEDKNNNNNINQDQNSFNNNNSNIIISQQDNRKQNCNNTNKKRSKGKQQNVPYISNPIPIQNGNLFTNNNWHWNSDYITPLSSLNNLPMLVEEEE